jgi:SAM-dependent MidA family methyltransferase
VSEEVAARVRAAIADHGPIRFDEYMGIALYGPGGFFEPPPVGPRGHFVTAPHVHPFVFAHCVRTSLLETWHALDEPDPFRVVELGAGDGTLAEALLDAFDELPLPSVDYVGVEISAGAPEALVGRGLQRRRWRTRPFEGVILANELLDNLPFVPVRGRASGPVEVRAPSRRQARRGQMPWCGRTLRPPCATGGEHDPVGAFAMLDSVVTACTEVSPADRLRSERGPRRGPRLPRAP